MKTLVYAALFVSLTACKKDDKKEAAPVTDPSTDTKPAEATPPPVEAAAPSEKDCVDEKNFKDLATCEALCAAGNATGCYVAGQEHLMNENEPKAAELFTKACDGDNPFGCKWLVPMHRTGLGGLPKDEAKAKALEDKARTLYPAVCEGGKVQACVDLAGLIADIDPAKSKQLYKLGCDAGWAGACDKAK